MFFDILPVFVLLFFSCLFLCTTTVHGLPSSSSSAADLSSKLRFVNPRPVLRVNQPSNGDMPDMFIGENHEDDDDSSYSSNEPSRNSKWLLQKFFEQDKQERKRSPLHSAVHSRTDSLSSSSAFKGDSTSNFNQIDEPIRLSPSLKTLIETNPFARAWLTMLLQKLMQEQHVPYIFKYGRRRK